MPHAIVTGAAGLVGSETVRFLAGQGFTVLGIDNNLREEFFGPDASTAWSRQQLEQEVPGYRHLTIDIRDQAGLQPVFSEFSSEISLVVHTAAQPSHDWAARAPHVDFSVNAVGTLNLLELTRQFAHRASFIFTSTNKVYGDTPNELPLIELESRWEVDPRHPFAEQGINETMSIDQSKHSLFGASKVAADILVQEYGRYFGMNTVCFRGGCLTGPRHSGTQLHGFLSYLVKCAVTRQRYTVLGYLGKQVRDNIHAEDLVQMFWQYHQHPRPGEVYNAGGSRHSNCSIREAVALCEELLGEPMDVVYQNESRSGDHIWYISDVRKFQSHYPTWSYRYTLRDIVEQIIGAMTDRHRV